MATAPPKFKVSELTVRVSGKTFAVDCKGRAEVARCGQNTARTFELETNGNLQQLMADLQKALDDLKPLAKQKATRKASREE